MSVNYVLVERENLQKPEEAPKVYAQAKSSGELTLKKLGKEIAEGSTTVSDSDVLAVLNDLVKFMRQHLDNGEIARFGDFGSFQISVSSQGTESEEKFNAALIHSSKVVFRPGTDLKEMLNNLKYAKTSKY